MAAKVNRSHCYIYNDDAWLSGRRESLGGIYRSSSAGFHQKK